MRIFLNDRIIFIEKVRKYIHRNIIILILHKSCCSILWHSVYRDQSIKKVSGVFFGPLDFLKLPTLIHETWQDVSIFYLRSHEGRSYSENIEHLIPFCRRQSVHMLKMEFLISFPSSRDENASWKQQNQDGYCGYQCLSL